MSAMLSMLALETSLLAYLGKNLYPLLYVLGE